MRESEAIYHSTVDALDIGVCLVDSDLKVKLCNLSLIQWCKEMNVPTERVIQSNVRECFPFFPADLLNHYEQVVVSGQAHRSSGILEAHGKTLIIATRIIPIIEEGHVRRMITIVEDVTKQRKIEDQLRQSQKMEAVGRLAGGVAHDFNNLLTVIMGHTELLLSNTTLQEEDKADIGEINEAAKRAANLTRQLLTFSRRQVIQKGPLNMNVVLGNLAKMLQRLIGEDISFHCGHTSDLPLIEADSGMMEQMIVNLAVNSRDVMPNGGTLYVFCKSVTLSQADCAYHPLRRPGSYVYLVNQDTGCGMDAAVLARIFEPFFTTKEVGKGTGQLCPSSSAKRFIHDKLFGSLPPCCCAAAGGQR